MAQEDLNQEQEIIFQHIIASHIYLYQEPPVIALPYARKNAKAALDKAIELKDSLWQGRAYMALAIIDKKDAKYPNASEYSKQAAKIYTTYQQGRTGIKNEVELSKIIPLQIETVIQSNQYSVSKDSQTLDYALRYYSTLNNEFKLNPFIVEIFENFTLRENNYDKDCSNCIISIDTAQYISTIRQISLKALSMPETELKKSAIQKVIKWYYKHKIKSPEIHAFEMKIKNDMVTCNIENVGKQGIELASDVDGNYLWSLTNKTDTINQLPTVVQMPKIQYIHKGLIHPTDKKWAVIELENKISVGYYDDKQVFKKIEKDFIQDAAKIISDQEIKTFADYVQHTADSNQRLKLMDNKFKEWKERLKLDLVPNDYKVLLTGKLVSTIVLVCYPDNFGVAMQHLNLEEISKTLEEIKYNINLEEIGVQLKNEEKSSLYTKLRYLKRFYTSNQQFKAEVEQFKKMIEIQLSQNKNNIYLSRNGYFGDYFGQILIFLKY